MDKIRVVLIALGLMLSTILDFSCAHPPKLAEPTVDNIQSTPLDPDILPHGPRAFPEALGKTAPGFRRWH